MKRAFPRKIKPVVVQPVSSDATGNQGRQVSPEVNRRACTSAAMIGLAISMGASSLLMPRQNDGAVAAEPLATEPTAALPSTYEAATSASAPEVEPASAAFSASQSMVEHAVQEGQTLWHLSKLYGVSADAIASSNGIAPGSVLHVGQVLRIPVTHETAAIPQAQTVVATSTTVSASDAVSSQPAAMSLTAPASHEVKDLLKQKQDSALDRLKQRRDALVVGLADLKSTAETSETTTQTPAVTAQPTEPVVAIASPAPDQPVVGATQLESVSQPETSVLPEVAIPRTTPAEPFKVEAAKPEGVPKVEVATLSPTVTQPFSAFEVSAPRVYKVAKGDTLDKIARDNNVSREQLIKANKIQDPNFILVNQVIRIPATKVRNADASPKFNRSVNVASTQLPSVLEREQPTVSVPNVTVPTLVAAEPDTVVALSPTPVVSAPTQQATILPSPLRSTKVASAGNTTVATAPLGTIPYSGSESEPASQFGDSSTYSPYAQNLKQEILRLREKYRNQATATAVPVVQPASAALPEVKVVAPRSMAVTQPVNPEFSASKYTQGLQEEIRGLQARQKVEQSVQTRTAEPAPRSANPQLVATAPLGSDAYDPLVQPLIGQTVSPDLPPLAAADRYLPNGGSHFKGYLWPAKGVLTSGYGWRWGRMHRGIDIAGPIGTPIVAAAPGVVVYAGWNSGGYGNLVEIQHPDGSVTRYAHNNRILVRNGQQVEQGEQIAEMGSTGYSTGPHSHFEVHLPGQGAVNPMAYLASR